MSDKTSDKASDKRYKITLTEKQLDLVGEAVEMMLRTVLGDGINVLQKQLLSELRSRYER